MTVAIPTIWLFIPVLVAVCSLSMWLVGHALDRWVEPRVRARMLAKLHDESEDDEEAHAA